MTNITSVRGAVDRNYKSVAQMKASQRIKLGDKITTLNYYGGVESSGDLKYKRTIGVVRVISFT